MPFVYYLGEDHTYEGSLINGYEEESGDPQTGTISSYEMTMISIKIFKVYFYKE